MVDEKGVLIVSDVVVTVTVVVERVPDGGVAVAGGVPLTVTAVVVVPTDSKNYYVIFTE